MTDKILMVKYYVFGKGVECAEFKINKAPYKLIRHDGDWECVNMPKNDPVYIRCKDDMIAIINSEKKMQYILGA